MYKSSLEDFYETEFKFIGEKYNKNNNNNKKSEKVKKKKYTANVNKIKGNTEKHKKRDVCDTT